MIFVRSAFGGFGNSFIKIKGAFKFKMLNFERSKAKLFVKTKVGGPYEYQVFNFEDPIFLSLTLCMIGQNFSLSWRLFLSSR